MGLVLQFRSGNSTPADCGNAAELLAAIDKIAQAAINGQIDGLMITLTKDGKVVGEQLAGEVSNDKPLATAAVFRMLQRIDSRRE